MQSWVIDLKTKHHYYPHGMHYCRDCPTLAITIYIIVKL